MHCVQMVPLHRPGAFALWVLALLVGASGCAAPTMTLTKRMASQGYCIWYPGESGIEPGQIWLYDGTLRSKFADRPENMPISTLQPVLPDVQGLNDGTGMLSSKFTELAISKAGEFDAELYAGSVRGGVFRLGPIESVSIDLGPSLLKDAQAKYGPAYATALQMVRDDTPGLVLIAAVVQVRRIDFTFYCEDSYKLLERLPRIQNMLHARVELFIVNEREVNVTMRPISGLLTIGVTPVRGESLLLSADEARNALGHDLMFAQKQSYALRIPIPNIISPLEEPAILPGDSAAKVVTKYRASTMPATQPAATQAGRVLSQDPTSRPITPP